MYVVDVIPFSRAAPAGSLSYRSRDALPEGTIVEVSLRRRQVQGLVVACTSVAEAKAMLKTASFQLTKTVPRVIGVLPDAVRAAAQQIAEYHAAPLGSALAALVGDQARSGIDLTLPLVPGTGYQEYLIEHPLAERVQAYDAHITDLATQEKSVLLIVPTIAETEYWKHALSAWKPLVLSSALVGRVRENALQASQNASVIICTPSYSWLPIPQLGAIIIERAGAGSYRAPKRPYLDMRTAARALARARSISCIIGDYPIPLEFRSDPTAPLASTEVNVRVIDTRRDPVQEDVAEPWAAVPRSLRSELEQVVLGGGRALVLAVRKGYAPSVVCRDCGTTRTDEHGNVLTFTKETSQGRAFRTVSGTVVERADVVCAVCGSWNLMPLGVGVERVEEELRAAFPDTTIIRFDGDLVRTATSARRALEHAHAPGTIVVGTEGALPWLLALHLTSFNLSAIASADSLLALPFWRARERFIRLGLLLATMSSRLVLGTRLPEDTAVRMVADPTSPEFFAEEVQLRRILAYPPFGTLLALQAEGTRTTLQQLDPQIRAALQGHTCIELPDRSITRTELRRSYVVKIPAQGWPDVALVRALQTLPPSVRILVDPESF